MFILIFPELIELGKHSLIPGSHLNITIGPSFKLGVLVLKMPGVPSFRDWKGSFLTNPENIELDPISCSVFLKQSGMKIDLVPSLKDIISLDKNLPFPDKRKVNKIIVYGASVFNPKLVTAKQLRLHPSISPYLESWERAMYIYWDQHIGYPLITSCASLLTTLRSRQHAIWYSSSILCWARNGIEAFVITEDNQIFIHLVFTPRNYILN